MGALYACPACGWDESRDLSQHPSLCRLSVKSRLPVQQKPAAFEQQLARLQKQLEERKQREERLQKENCRLEEELIQLRQGLQLDGHPEGTGDAGAASKPPQGRGAVPLREANGPSKADAGVPGLEDALWTFSLSADDHSLFASSTTVLPAVFRVPAVYGGAAVTRLGTDAFSGHDELREVILPEGIVSLGEQSFWGCRGLQVVQLPSTLREIESGAFSICSQLTEIRLPEGLVRLGESAFCGCTSLRQVILPSTLRKIGPTAFSGCKSLRTIEIPDGVQNLDLSIILGCDNLEWISLPRSWRKWADIFLLPYHCRIIYR